MYNLDTEIVEKKKQKQACAHVVWVRFQWDD